MEYLQHEIDRAEGTPARLKFRKELEGVTRKQSELKDFDDELRHYADRRITLDLDDGVRVNYGKFGSLLAETRAVTFMRKKE